LVCKAGREGERGVLYVYLAIKKVFTSITEKSYLYLLDWVEILNRGRRIALLASEMRLREGKLK